MKIQVSFGNGIERKEKEMGREGKGERERDGGAKRWEGAETLSGHIKCSLMPRTHAHFCVSGEWWSPE